MMDARGHDVAKILARGKPAQRAGQSANLVKRRDVLGKRRRDRPIEPYCRALIDGTHLRDRSAGKKSQPDQHKEVPHEPPSNARNEPLTFRYLAEFVKT